MLRAAALLLSILAGCASAPPPEPAWVWEADPDLVALGGTTRVDIEVDWFEQVPPDDLALDGDAKSMHSEPMKAQIATFL